MNVKKYLGEDKELIERIKKKDNSVKVFFTTKLFIYHKERNIKKFLLQKVVFGSDVFNIMKFGNEIRAFQPILPFLVTFSFILLMFINIEVETKYLLMLVFVTLIQLIIFIDVRKYLKGLKKTILTMMLINFANLAFTMGNIIALLGVKNFMNKKAYLKSRHNK
jgi:hypothetical protein